MSESLIMKIPIKKAMEEGLAAHKAGKLQDAEMFYRIILKSQKTHVNSNSITAHYNLGTILQELGGWMRLR